MNNERVREIAWNAESQPLVGIWSQTEDDTPFFEERRDWFFYILDRLLREARIRLHKNGVFLQGSIEAQLDTLRRAFPLSEEDADRRSTLPGYKLAYEGAGMDAWWYLDSCPAGVAWRLPDGTYQVAE